MHMLFFSFLTVPKILQTIGNGAVAQVILGATASSFDFGSQLSINLGYGLGGMIGAFMAGGVTGAHMNPAVTLAMALRGKLNWLKVIGCVLLLPLVYACMGCVYTDYGMYMYTITLISLSSLKLNWMYSTYAIVMEY